MLFLVPSLTLIYKAEKSAKMYRLVVYEGPRQKFLEYGHLPDL
jgi:hypothetical protein